MHEAGIPLASVKWFQAGVNQPGRAEKVKLKLPDGVSLTPVPTKSLEEMLIDGDIDARPFIVWDKALADFNLKSDSSTGKSIALLLARIQTLLFFPMLSIARFNWSWQSIEVAFRNGKNLEGALCISHWILGLTIAGYLTPGAAWTGWAWFLIAQCIGGLILACVFVLSHTGMEVYDATNAEGFYDRQARSTRNTPTSEIGRAHV